MRMLRDKLRLLLAGSAALLGCGPANVDNAPAGAPARTAELYASSLAAHWPRNAATPNGARIPVCYQYGSTLNTNELKAAADAEIPVIRNDVENTWARVADITFTGWAKCGTSTGGRILLTIEASTYTGNDRSEVGYRGSSSPTQMWLKLRSPRDSSIAVHEFGHALGFEHEFSRDDFPCSGSSDACYACTTDADCSGESVIANYGPTCLNGYCRQPNGVKLGNASSADADSIMMRGYAYNRPSRNGAQGRMVDPVNYLSAYDVLGAQQFYDRKPAGSLVGLGGRCAVVAGGTLDWARPIVAYRCRNLESDRWRYWPAVGLVQSLIGGFWGWSTGAVCLNISGGTLDPNGSTPLISWGCGNYANEKFEFPTVQVRAMGNMLLMARNSTAGSDVILARRGQDWSPDTALLTQRWKIIPRDIYFGNGQVTTYTGFQLAGTNLCMTTNGTDYGNLITLETCSYAIVTRQAFSTTGGVLTPYGVVNRCLNVLGGSDAPGQLLGIWDACDPSYVNSFFYLSGTVHSTMADSTQCVDMLGGRSYDNASIGMYPCVDTAPNHQWDYYWL